MSDAIAWGGIKDALQAWLVNSTGIASARVLFGGQNVQRPLGSGAWVSIRITGNSSKGRASVLQIATPSPSPGSEVTNRSLTWRKITGTVEIYPPEEVTDATEAMNYASNALAISELPGQLALFRAAGIGMLQTGDALVIDGTIGTTRIEPRVSFPLTFTVPSEVDEFLTNIETVNLEIDTTTPTFAHTFTVNLDPGDTIP